MRRTNQCQVFIKIALYLFNQVSGKNSNICVVGDKRNVQKIVDAVQEMEYTMKGIAGRISTDTFPLSESSFHEMSIDISPVM